MNTTSFEFGQLACSTAQDPMLPYLLSSYMVYQYVAALAMACSCKRSPGIHAAASPLFQFCCFMPPLTRLWPAVCSCTFWPHAAATAASLFSASSVLCRQSPTSTSMKSTWLSSVGRSAPTNVTNWRLPDASSDGSDVALTQSESTPRIAVSPESTACPVRLSADSSSSRANYTAD